MPAHDTFVELRPVPTSASIDSTMNYIGQADVGWDAEVEAIRQCVFEIEHAQRLPARQTMRHIVAITILSLTLFCVVVLLILL